jgi:hypothetical protein
MVGIVRPLILQYQYVVRLLGGFSSAEDGTGRQFFHRFLMKNQKYEPNYLVSS